MLLVCRHLDFDTHYRNLLPADYNTRVLTKVTTFHLPNFCTSQRPVTCAVQKYPLPNSQEGLEEQAILEEFDDAREVVHQLSTEYQESEKGNYLFNTTDSNAPVSSFTGEQYDSRVPQPAN